jgi:hypothetical protein
MIDHLTSKHHEFTSKAYNENAPYDEIWRCNAGIRTDDNKFTTPNTEMKVEFLHTCSAWVEKSGEFTIVPLEPQIHWHIIEREVICETGHTYNNKECAISFHPPLINVEPYYDNLVFEQDTLLIDFNVDDDDHPEPMLVDVLIAPQGLEIFNLGENQYVLEWTPQLGMAQPGPYQITIAASDNGGKSFDTMHDLYIYVLERP